MLGRQSGESAADRSARGAEMASRFALRCLGPKVVRHEDLGILGALAVVPRHAAATLDQVQALERLAGTPSGLEDLRALEAFLRTGSLRGAAREIYVHHSIVARRLDRGFVAMALDCQDPAHRFTAQLAVYLWTLSSTHASGPNSDA